MIKIRKSLPEFEHKLSEDEAVTFKLRPLSEVELEQMNYLLIDMIKSGHQVLPPDAIKYCLDKCLLDWCGVTDENDRQMIYKKGDEQYLPTKVRLELASEIYVASTLTDEEKKS